MCRAGLRIWVGCYRGDVAPASIQVGDHDGLEWGAFPIAFKVMGEHRLAELLPTPVVMALPALPPEPPLPGRVSASLPPHALVQAQAAASAAMLVSCLPHERSACQITQPGLGTRRLAGTDMTRQGMLEVSQFSLLENDLEASGIF